MIEKKSLQSLLENKVLTKLIDPSEGLICRQKKNQTNNMAIQENYALGIRAQKGERQVSQTWERLLKRIKILQYTEKNLGVKLL